MRAITTPGINVVSLLEAFNMIGRRMNADQWNGDEAAAIRLGQRAKADPDTHRRGQDALQVMKHFAANGWLNLIYTDEIGRRIPYFQSPGYWLTAIYPDPVGTGDGMIELDDRYIQPCVADTCIRSLALPMERFGSF